MKDNQGRIKELAGKFISKERWFNMPEGLKDAILTERLIMKMKEKKYCVNGCKKEKYCNLDICKECWIKKMDRDIEGYKK